MEPTSLPSADAEERMPDGEKEPLVKRYFTKAGQDPFDTVTWERRDVRAGDFSQAGVEVPTAWSDDSIGIVAKLYFATVDGVKEDSVRQMIGRVVGKITVEGINQGHFNTSRPRFSEESNTNVPNAAIRTYIHQLDDDDPARIFYNELVFICLHQIAGFNTPTWLNIGVTGRRQCGHACYPLSIQDHMLGEDSITDWWRKEAIIFKTGGGTGINLSNLRGSMEKLSTGGKASGPLPYMRAANAGAETLKSGGVHRRAAKFVCLDIDHPDIEDFIWCKVREDERMVRLMEAGEDLSIFTAEGERNVAEVTSFQSANNSVGLSDVFMNKVENDSEWDLIARTTGEITKSLSAEDLLRKIAEAAWRCADPGVMFIDTINKWHTTPSIGKITTTNTCGEIVQNDDTACNLAALNVLKFLSEDKGDLKVQDFRHVIEVMLTSMDIVNGFSELPTARIQQNTRDLRQCGLGFTNLGAAIMAQALPYDSDEGRDFAAACTALLTGHAYYHSARMAERLGSFKHFDDNRTVMIDVIDQHLSHLPEVNPPSLIWEEAIFDWHMAAAVGQAHGYRNSQATAMMPTGTVSFLLGADTTGIEPAFSLVTHKSLAAGGTMVMINQSAQMAANALGGYSEDNLKAMAEGDFSCISPEDLPSFATAVGENSIKPMGHLKMVAAIQPFVSQAISKTTNLPNEATVDDIYDLYLKAWHMGVKVLSVYRDGSKATQVLSSKSKIKTEINAKDVKWTIQDTSVADVSPVRKRLPRTRQSLTHKIHVRSSLGEHEGYITAGMYPDGSLGEVFLEGFGRLGGFTQNVLSAWATSISISIQYGVPIEAIIRKHVGHTDETGGIVVPTKGEKLVVRKCSSIVDYISCWLASEFGSDDLCEQLGVMTDAVKARKMGTEVMDATLKLTPYLPENVVDYALKNGNGNGHAHSVEMSAQECPECRGSMRRTGACLTCSECFYNTGCG